MKLDFPLVKRFSSDPNDHLPARCELDRIADQMSENLPQPCRVADESIGHFRIDAAGQIEPLGLSPLAKSAQEVAKNLTEPELVRFEIELPGFDLGEIEQIVDDRQK